ncbi:MAG: PEP-CTERM sorting domain-containing protein [Armatimonadota bacterium]|nr:PEP-CTERM sorting domain-containing protein [Armatimonadota bacterium]
MIKKLILILILIFIIIVPGQASQDEWLWFFKASDSDGNNGAPGGYIGTTSSDIDGYQSTKDKYLDLSLLSGLAAYGVYHANSSDWTGPTGYYRQDIRAPLNQNSPMKNWQPLYIWAGPSYSNNVIKLSWTPGMGGNYLPDATVSYKLTLVDNKGVNGAPPNGMFWILNPQSAGSILLPAIKTTNPNIDAYVFDFQAALVPEPASIFAILIGTLGIAKKRLKMQITRKPSNFNSKHF